MKLIMGYFSLVKFNSPVGVVHFANSTLMPQGRPKGMSGRVDMPLHVLSRFIDSGFCADFDFSAGSGSFFVDCGSVFGCDSSCDSGSGFDGDLDDRQHPLDVPV